MAYLLRLRFFVLFAVMFGVIATPAQASFPSTASSLKFSWPTGGGVADYNWKTTKEAACTDGIGKLHFGNTVSASAAYGNEPWRCSVDFVGGGAAIVNLAYDTVPESCPANSTLSGGQCTCTAPYTQNAANNGCELVDADTAACNDAALLDSASFGNRDVTVPGKIGTGFVCMETPGVSAGKGCRVAFTRDASYQKPDGTWLSEGTYSRPSGAGTCTTSPAPADVPVLQPDTCKNGQPGTVNGVTVCIPFAKHTPTETSTTKGETVTPPGGTPTTTTEQNTTVCTGAGSCTTTTTTTTTVGGGAPTTTTKETTQSKAEHCVKSPGAKECQGEKGSSFSGDCAAGFSYEGDAIQGALAREVHKQNCIVNAESDESALYATEKAKTGDQTGDLPGNQTVTVGSADFDSSDAIGGAACITNKTVVVWGKSVVLPFSDVCPALGYLKAILLAVSWLSAARIVIGRTS